MALHGGDLRAAAAQYGLPPAAFLDFSANINPAGPPPGMAASLTEALPWVAHYPEPFARTLGNALAARAGVTPESLLVANGAAEALYLALRLGRGRPALLPRPGFAEYGRAALAAGSPVVSYALRAEEGFRVDVQALAEAAARHQAGLVVLNNPHNPSGSLLPAHEVLWLADRLALLDAWLVVDEAFVDFLAVPGGHTLIHEAARASHLVVVRSLTKFYALPGLRVGYAVMTPDVVRLLDAARDPWSVSALAQAAALAALQDQAYAEGTREWIATERPWLAAALAELPGLQVFTPSANYILVDAAATGQTAARLQEQLGPRGILLRDCASFAGLGPTLFRTAVRSRAENKRLIGALREVLG